MADRFPEACVSAQWLLERKGAPDLRLVDASWFMPDDGRDARAEFEAEHIEGAVFFSIDDIADKQSPLPHMAPSSVAFSSAARRLGLGDGSMILVYDRNGFMASARVWWMFRLMGHQAVAVLDGGLDAWKRAGGAVSDLSKPVTRRHFTAKVDNALGRELDQLRANLIQKKEQVVDARSAARFRGDAPEPRPGVRPGHVPGSRNLHHASLLEDNKTLKRPDALRALFDDAGVDIARPIVTTCGSGVSAAILNLALHRLGVERSSMYDGSWVEWGGRDDTPAERG